MGTNTAHIVGLKLTWSGVWRHCVGCLRKSRPTAAHRVHLDGLQFVSNTYPVWMGCECTVSLPQGSRNEMLRHWKGDVAETDRERPCRVRLFSQERRKRLTGFPVIWVIFSDHWPPHTHHTHHTHIHTVCREFNTLSEIQNFMNTVISWCEFALKMFCMLGLCYSEDFKHLGSDVFLSKKKVKN